MIHERKGSKVRIEIFGPNLPRPESNKAEFHVHAAGCQDGERLARRLDEPRMPLDVQCRLEAEAYIYDFAPDENPDYTLGDWLDEFHFAPCLDDLPERKGKHES